MATWDRDLIYQRSLAMGQEFFDTGIQIALTPVTGGTLGRSPRGGRNFEACEVQSLCANIYNDLTIHLGNRGSGPV